MVLKKVLLHSEDLVASSKNRQNSAAASAWTTNMGYTGDVAPAETYPSQAFPNFYKALDSPDTEIEDADSPMTAEFEQFLEMVVENENMYPPPPYQGSTGYVPTQSGYPSFQNQYISNQYQQYDNYVYTQNTMQTLPAKPPSKPVQHNMTSHLVDTSAKQANIYCKSETIIHSQNQEDNAVQSPKKARIATETENSNDGSTYSKTTDEKVSGVSMRGFPSECSQIQALRPSSTTTNRSSKFKTDKSKAAVTLASKSTRTKKDAITIKVPEEILYEEAKSKPIKHRKEPDIVETKGRSVRNAINARVNRQKHKLYVDGLELELLNLKNANETLEQRHQDSLAKMAEMQKHVQYLENVIANDITISKIITSIGSIDTVKLTSSFDRKRKYSADSTSSISSSVKNAKVSGGVCLHVDNNNVSIEFCEKCAEKAKQNMNEAA